MLSEEEFRAKKAAEKAARKAAADQEAAIVCEHAFITYILRCLHTA